MGTRGAGNGPRARTLHPLALLLVACLTACGSASQKDAAPPPRGPEGEALPPPADEDAQDPLDPAGRQRHIEDALREVDLAERSIERTFGERSGGEKPRPPDEPVPRGGEAPADCRTACEALVAMERAAGYVCRLAGDADPRCRSAQERVKAARAKVGGSSCACPQPVSLAPVPRGALSAWARR